MSRKHLYIYISAGVLFLFFIGFLFYTFHTEQVTSSSLQQRYQMQDTFNNVLEDKERELGIPLRSFTLEEEDQMLRGERTPEEIVEGIVLECATPAPVLSGKTNEEVTAEFKIILDHCKKDFTLKMDLIIANVKVDYQKITLPEQEEELILDYVDQIAQIEKECDELFAGYVEDLKNAYLAVDGSLGTADNTRISSFKKEYETEKEKQISRFAKEYNK